MSANVNRSLSAWQVSGVPLAAPGDEPATLLRAGLLASDLQLCDGDVVVVASKFLSRCRGRSVALATVTPSSRARALGAKTDKDPRLVELILKESARVSRAASRVLIVRHKLGHVSANAAIDASNTLAEGSVLLLPEDPDEEARSLRAQLSERFGATVAVIVSDSFGRPFRVGTVGVAIGCAGIEPVADRRGAVDLRGRVMEATWVATADALAAMADLVMGQGDQAIPAVVIRGAQYRQSDRGARAICRDPEHDLYV